MPLDPADLPAGVEPRVRLDVHVGTPNDTESVTVDGLDIRPVDGLDETDVATWMRVVIEANVPAPDIAELWRRMAPFMARTPGWSSSRRRRAGRGRGRRVAVRGGRGRLAELGIGGAGGTRSRHPAGTDRRPLSTRRGPWLRPRGRLGTRRRALVREPGAGGSGADRPAGRRPDDGPGLTRRPSAPRDGRSSDTRGGRPAAAADPGRSAGWWSEALDQRVAAGSGRSADRCLRLVRRRPGATAGIGGPPS